MYYLIRYVYYILLSIGILYLFLFGSIKFGPIKHLSLILSFQVCYSLCIMVFRFVLTMSLSLWFSYLISLFILYLFSLGMIFPVTLAMSLFLWLSYLFISYFSIYSLPILFRYDLPSYIGHVIIPMAVIPFHTLFLYLFSIYSL